jgi:hypothetical protein
MKLWCQFYDLRFLAASSGNEWEIISELLLLVQFSVSSIHYLAQTHLVCQFLPPSTENICNYSLSCVLFFTLNSQYYWFPFLTPFILCNPAHKNTKRSRDSSGQGFQHPLPICHLRKFRSTWTISGYCETCMSWQIEGNNTVSDPDIVHFFTQALSVKV